MLSSSLRPGSHTVLSLFCRKSFPNRSILCVTRSMLVGFTAGSLYPTALAV